MPVGGERMTIILVNGLRIRARVIAHTDDALVVEAPNNIAVTILRSKIAKIEKEPA